LGTRAEGQPEVGATKTKVIVIFHGVMERARRSYRLPNNPVAGIEKPRSATRTTINVFSPEEVHALVRAAACDVDAAIFLTAAFTGLRQGELVALRWRDVEFAGAYIRVTSSYTRGQPTEIKRQMREDENGDGGGGRWQGEGSEVGEGAGAQG
jgi:integrase